MSKLGGEWRYSQESEISNTCSFSIRISPAELRLLETFVCGKRSMRMERRYFLTRFVLGKVLTHGSMFVDFVLKASLISREGLACGFPLRIVPASSFRAGNRLSFVMQG
jgi:hypothetical protein